MSTDNRYEAAYIKVDVVVDAYEMKGDENRRPAQRTVKLNMHQVFRDDDDLEAAIESFSKMIIDAARR